MALSMKTTSSEVRGARDLGMLWHNLPAAALRYPLSAQPDLGSLSDALRARAWREHCAEAKPKSCAERGENCPKADQGICHADLLFPMRLGGGVQKWRMATLFLQWWPSMGVLHLIALGQTAVDSLPWAAAFLHQQHGLTEPAALPVFSFGDLELHGAHHWRLRFITPWVVGKQKSSEQQSPNQATVKHELGKAMLARAYKLTALCAEQAIWQRLGGHLVHHIAEDLLDKALRVDEVRVRYTADMPGFSVSNDNAYIEQTWDGEITLFADEVLLPWLTLLAICGGGENVDKGKGRVELLPLG